MSIRGEWVRLRCCQRDTVSDANERKKDVKAVLESLETSLSLHDLRPSIHVGLVDVFVDLIIVMTIKMECEENTKKRGVRARKVSFHSKYLTPTCQ